MVTPGQGLVTLRVFNSLKAAYTRRAGACNQIVFLYHPSTCEGDACLEALPVLALIIVDSIFLVNLILRLLLLLLLLLLGLLI